MKEAFVPFSVGPRSCIGIKYSSSKNSILEYLLTICSLAKMELNKLTAAFFLRLDGRVNESMQEEDMEMYDVFSASPVGGRLVLNLTEPKD